jgi:hypothetical protein
LAIVGNQFVPFQEYKTEMKIVETERKDLFFAAGYI